VLGPDGTACLVTLGPSSHFSAFKPFYEVTGAITERLSRRRGVSTSVADGTADEARTRLTHLCMLGNIEFVLFLRRSRTRLRGVEQMGGRRGTRGTPGRPRITSANVASLLERRSRAMRDIAESIRTLCNDLLLGRVPRHAEGWATARIGSVPLLAELKQPSRFIPDVLTNPERTRRRAAASKATGVAMVSTRCS